jgi:hypothetical protein
MAASIAARLPAAPEALALKLDCGAATASDGAEDCAWSSCMASQAVERLSQHHSEGLRSAAGQLARLHVTQGPIRGVVRPRTKASPAAAGTRGPAAAGVRAAL